MKEKMVTYPLQERYCITKTPKYSYFMAPITEEEAHKLLNDKFYEFNVLDHKIDFMRVITIIDEAKDVDHMHDVKGHIKDLFNRDNIVCKPAKYNHDTRVGSNKHSECNGYIDHYKYGLSTIGNPDMVIIYKLQS